MKTRIERFRERDTQGVAELAERVRSIAHPLKGTEDLDPLLDRIGDARCVLLGEASHGTSEYYTWRARMSERLIREKGFSFIAVEGDWPDCYEVNRFAKGYPGSGRDAREALLRAFERWPTWMWANEEVVLLAEWLRGHNERLPQGEKIGFRRGRRSASTAWTSTACGTRWSRSSSTWSAWTPARSRPRGAPT